MRYPVHLRNDLKRVPNLVFLTSCKNNYYPNVDEPALNPILMDIFSPEKTFIDLFNL